MSVATHTPGPWIYRKGTMHYAGERERINRFVIGRPLEGRGNPMLQTAVIEGPFPLGINQAEANARLIAAAPYLLEACKSILDEVEGLVVGAGMERLSALARCRLAVAKAEGRS